MLMITHSSLVLSIVKYLLKTFKNGRSFFSNMNYLKKYFITFNYLSLVQKWFCLLMKPHRKIIYRDFQMRNLTNFELNVKFKKIVLILCINISLLHG